MKLNRAFIASLFAAGALLAPADNLVILHTNDTHSQLDPNDNDLGGILRRKVLVDSVRAEQPNVLLIDCGDMVQGTLYFSIYKGEAEREMMNNLGYDIQILGNHEFDNGIEPLAHEWSLLNADKITSNYDLRDTPLDTIFKPYTIKEFAGKRIGFLAINLDPKGMIADFNTGGLKYLDGIKAANSIAWYLKHVERVDEVIALTHVGYDSANPPTPSDRDLAQASEDIDIIIGGHSHTTIDPAAAKTPEYYVKNAAGDPVLVVQTGSKGLYLGEITLDLDSMRPSYRLIPVDSRLDNRIDSEAAALLAKYRKGVDALKMEKIGKMAQEMPHGSHLIVNWVADVMLEKGKELTDRNVDVALVNKGGIRRGLPAGHITKEHILTMLPFDNKLVVMEIKGSDLKAAFDVFAQRNGDGISAGFNPAEIDPDRTYTLVTIDYLANGGDYLTTLPNGKVIARSALRLDETMIDYILSQKGKNIKYNDRKRRL
ncbi:bifunctional UDP-sugar hydrolase/5'-nucleotidase [uncultured Muribaculum sp.]|uniref:bifunctional metallophosphatase/5'-nucleotidase n=1 Tax=uncultured Muribaculum sp. TaxID=1918613 RepID=UPI0025951BF3|nr:bifunctional UDP-sugar hydrolase/5'-nucleotidase [uncultured Muribaculum sp.]